MIVLVIDGLGVGALPDAGEYGDAGTHTLSHLADAVGGLHLPTLEALGLGHITAIKGVRAMGQPEGLFGRLGFLSKGVDSMAGYWEIAGLQTDSAGPLYPDGFPPELVAVLQQTLGRKILGNRRASGAAMLREYETAHLASGSLLVWTDGRRTCHVAGHENAIRQDELFQRCRDARKLLKDRWGIWRVSAYPLTGDAGAVQFATHSREFVIEPPGQTMMDVLNRAGQIVIGVGKVGDLFSSRGLTWSIPVGPWTALFTEVTGMLKKAPRGLIVAGLNVLEPEAAQSAAALHDFDRRLPELLEQLRPGDLLVLTGNHGQDFTKTDQVATREYVPLLATGPKLAQGVNLGIRTSAADLGHTIVEALQGDQLPVGESFLNALRAA
ncbi:MAG: phosphopentomutase [Nitrospira sp.]|nr:phosphopentomutase [Nitrospira sp.]MBP0120770.1 phosphopentomutase [Nitrospira sp.]MBP0124662.1 phosphopentomutase [Nitrospira sp.]MBP0127766.1 phosphopentomutase [Nitrospira sp.]MBP0130842.1 phosphopentomutase [Nitrospira sp.]